MRVLLTGASGGIGQAMAQALVAAARAVLGVGRGERPVRRGHGAGTPGTAQGVTQQARLWPPEAGLHSAAGDVARLTPPARIAAAAAWQTWSCTPRACRPSARWPHTHRADAGRAADQPAGADAADAGAAAAPAGPAPQAQVVFVGSALGRIGLPGFSVYGASKAGLHGFAEALRRELADTALGARADLGPRSTRTGFNGAGVEAYNQRHRHRDGRPEAVAEALRGTCSKAASRALHRLPRTLAVR
jgi:NAD(P)-dependent dehydrogenase (short-subunit alcohol dehydrogenase family)